MALPNLIQQSLAADRLHAALIGPPQHIDDGLAAGADDLNITGQHQLPSLTVEGEGDRSARINNSSAILFERCPDAYLTPFSVEGFGERHHDAGVFAPTFGAAVGALLGAVVVQQNNAAADWIADGATVEDILKGVVDRCPFESSEDREPTYLELVDATLMMKKISLKKVKRYRLLRVNHIQKRKLGR